MKMQFKDPFSGFSHLIGFVAAVVGVIVLVVKTYQDPAKLITMLIYGGSLVLLYGASSMYHLVKTSPAKEKLLRKFDHVSIFILIAGCCTPVFYYGLDGTWRTVMLLLVWTFSGAGIILKTAYINVHRALSALLYVATGWLALIPVLRLAQVFPINAVILMLIGGLFYTVGATVYATKKLDFFPKVFGFHEVFHLFVLAGSITHYALILRYIAPLS